MVGMKSSKTTLALLFILAAFGASACRNTYNGVKADSKKAVHKTGEKLENVGR